MDSSRIETSVNTTQITGKDQYSYNKINPRTRMEPVTAKPETTNVELEKYRIEKPLRRMLTVNVPSNEKTLEMKTVNNAIHY